MRLLLEGGLRDGVRILRWDMEKMGVMQLEGYLAL